MLLPAFSNLNANSINIEKPAIFTFRLIGKAKFTRILRESHPNYSLIAYYLCGSKRLKTGFTCWHPIQSAC